MGPGEIQHDWLVRGRDGSCEVVICFPVWICLFFSVWPLVEFSAFFPFRRSIVFNPDGSCLYSGSENTLRVYGWEPDRCFDVVHVGWGKVSDLAISNNQMVCTFIHYLSFSFYIQTWVGAILFCELVFLLLSGMIKWTCLVGEVRRDHFHSDLWRRVQGPSDQKRFLRSSFGGKL